MEAGTSVGSVAVDHCFDVKGAGTVVLGCVAEGSIGRHDAVKVHPVGRDAEIRSVQKHDDDFNSAAKGDRVGLSLKGVSVRELDGGTVLSSDGRLANSHEIAGCAHLVRYWPNPLREGMMLHVGHWMQFDPAKILSVSTGTDWCDPDIRLELQKDFVHPPSSMAAMTHVEGGKLRVVGTLDLG